MIFVAQTSRISFPYMVRPLSHTSRRQFNRFVINFDGTREDFVPGTIADSNLIHADDDIIVFEKPANLLSAPGLKDKYNLATAIAEMYDIPRVDQMLVHRIDYATSGLLVFARSQKALVELHKNFREKRKIFKRYTAVVHGVLPDLEGEIDLPIGRDPIRGPPYFHIDTTENGKPSLTYWTVMKRGDNKTYVHLRPISGRTHQLRLHMAAIGHPILGDFFYAPDDAFNAANRLMLHAETLGLVHPVTKKEMLFKAPCPLKCTV
eukprot:gene6050-12200_t